METRNAGATVRGIGLPASIGEGIASTAARAAEAAGYHSFWLNNPPGADVLGALGAIGSRVQGIWLGVGIIPLSHRSAADIAKGALANHVPLDRFYLGIGSGSGAGGVARVRDGCRELQSSLDTTVVVAALGPVMCRLAGEMADGVLLNWLTPAFATQSIAWVREGAERAGKPMPRIMAYVRAAMGNEAIGRLQREADQYAGIGHYAAHFERMGVTSIDTTVRGQTPEEIQRGLAAWDGVVDELVVRAIPSTDSSDAVTAILEAAAP